MADKDIVAAVLSNEDMTRLAKVGARLQVERVFNIFPDLRKEFAQAAMQASLDGTGPSLSAKIEVPGRPKQKRRKMSPEARDRISRQMKSHWRKRRREREHSEA